MRGLLVASGLLAIARASDSVNYESMLEGLFAQVDVDGDSFLDSNEFVAANTRLGISASAYFNHNGNYNQFFAALDIDSNGEVTRAEMADAVTNFRAYETILVNAFTNNATTMSDDELSNMITVPEAMKLAEATVVQTVVLNAPPGEIYPGTRAAMKTYYANLGGVPESALLMQYQESTRRRLSAAHRKLQSSATTMVTATYFLENEAAAAAVEAALPPDATALATVPVFADLGILSVSAPVADHRVTDLPMSDMYVLAGILIAVLIALIVNACYWTQSTSTRAKGGCCSFDALKAWVFGQLLAAGAIVGTVVILYTRISPVTDAIVGLLTMLLDDLPRVSTELNYPALDEFTEMIPEDMMDILRDNREQFKNLDEAVMLPGFLAAAFLALGALCPLVPARKGSLCFSKVYMLLALLFLILAMVFYILFASAAIFFAEAPEHAPGLNEEVNRIRGLCVQLPASIGQRITDANSAISNLQAAGQDVTTYTESINTATSLQTLLDGGCLHLIDLLDELVEVFVPAMQCIVAIAFAVIVNQTLCCSAGCCRGPPKTSPGGTKSNGEQVVMSV